MKTPNKMKSPMKDGKKHDHPHDRINGVPGSGLEGMGKDGKPVAKMKAPVKFNEKLRAAKAAGKLSDEFAAVVKMKSPAKMASGFKMKSAPVNMRTPGSVAKMAGVSPMKMDNQAKADRLNSMADKYSNDPSFRAAQVKYNQAAVNDKTSGKETK